MSTNERPELGHDIEPGRRIASILARLERHRHVLDSQTELSTAILRILWLLRETRPSTLAEIASELKLEQSTVNRQVNAAHAAGLLDRERREAGGSYVFTPTRAGSDAFERDEAATLGAYAAALDAMGDVDAERFLDLAQHFLDGYGEVVAYMDARHSGQE